MHCLSSMPAKALSPFLLPLFPDISHRCGVLVLSSSCNPTKITSSTRGFTVTTLPDCRLNCAVTLHGLCSLIQTPQMYTPVFLRVSASLHVFTNPRYLFLTMEITFLFGYRPVGSPTSVSFSGCCSFSISFFLNHCKCLHSSSEN